MNFYFLTTVKQNMMNLKNLGFAWYFQVSLFRHFEERSQRQLWQEIRSIIAFDLPIVNQFVRKKNHNFKSKYVRKIKDSFLL